jgi:oligoribonuclease NrnB/cAMP/cGMP phosphodiesterase (DHH superfamily)
MQDQYLAKFVSITLLSLAAFPGCSTVKSSSLHDNALELNASALVAAHVEAMEMVKPAYIQMLTYVKSHDVWDVFDDDHQNTFLPENIPAVLAGLEEFNEALHAASVPLKPFLKSTSSDVRIAAQNSLEVYQNLIDKNKSFIKQLNSAAPGAFIREEWEKISYDIVRSLGNFTFSLYHSSEWVGEALKKDLNRLSQEQRAEIMKRVKALYRAPDWDEGIEILLYEGGHFCNTAANLYEILNSTEPVN